jgi:tripartite-type tricarboxylate transporter receptor subunit TctC
MTVASSSPQALVARVAAERAHWQRVIRAQGIQAD